MDWGVFQATLGCRLLKAVSRAAPGGPRSASLGASSHPAYTTGSAVRSNDQKYTEALFNFSMTSEAPAHQL